MSFRQFAAVLLATLSLSLSALGLHDTAPVVNNEFVQKEFGDNCKMVGMPSIQADLNGDGVQDIVIPARCSNPLMDRGEYSYAVVDPYDDFFGYGNPRITTQFASEDPERRGFSLLIIHGAGDDGWYSDAPKAKFMIVNLPFKDIHVKVLSKKKKRERIGIYVNETGGEGLASVVFWDGRKYRYIPMGSDME